MMTIINELLQSDIENKVGMVPNAALNPENTPLHDLSNLETTIQAISPGNFSYRVLIVDDNTSFQKLLTLTLSMQPQIGVIDCVSSGEEAIQQAKVSNYDMIFMDAMMPGMDGYQTCALLRKYANYKDTPIIMVTGLTSPLDEAKAIIAGSTTYVTKPVQQIPFKETLSRAIFMIEYKKKLAQ